MVYIFYAKIENEKINEVNTIINEIRTSVVYLAGIENKDVNNAIKNSYLYY